MNEPTKTTGFLTLHRGRQTVYENEAATLTLEWPPQQGWVQPWLITVPAGLKDASWLLGHPDEPDTWFDASFSAPGEGSEPIKTYLGKMIINATIMDVTTCRVVEPLTVQLTAKPPRENTSHKKLPARPFWRSLVAALKFRPFHLRMPFSYASRAVPTAF